MTRAGYSSIDELPLSAQARSLWGKTDRDAGEQWLPLYVHMSDSALVAKQIWDEWLPEGTRKIIADEFDGDAVLARKTTMFLAGIHDLGKATPVFQSKPITYAPNAADGSMAWIPEKVGLMLLQRDSEEKVRLLPWVEVNGKTSDGIVVPVNNVPPEDVAKAMVQSSVHLPAAMSRYSGKEDEGIDELIPPRSMRRSSRLSVPRKRGDDPAGEGDALLQGLCSPQARG